MGMPNEDAEPDRIVDQEFSEVYPRSLNESEIRQAPIPYPGGVFWCIVVYHGDSTRILVD